MRRLRRGNAPVALLALALGLAVLLMPPMGAGPVSGPLTAHGIGVAQGCPEVTPWGDLLRGCYVTPPAPPTLAPDGLPFGVVGSNGAQGQAGAATFPRGTPTVIGVAWATVAGTVTTISSNTFWGNQSSISLVGNVTVSAGKTLTIYNSGVNWSETSTTTNWAYGFNVSSGGSGTLLILHGSIVGQTNPSTTRAWYIWGTGAVNGFNVISFSHSLPLIENFTVNVDNSTLNTPSSSTVSHGGKNTGGGWWSPPKSTGLEVSYFNDSTYNGFSTFNASDPLNVTLGAHNSKFSLGNATVANPVNDTFITTRLGLTGSGGNWGGPPVGGTRLRLSYDTIKNVTYTSGWYLDCLAGVYQSVNTAPSCGPTGVFINRTAFLNLNLSGFKSTEPLIYHGQTMGLETYGGNFAGDYIAQNDSIRNVMAYTGATVLLGGLINNNFVLAWNDVTPSTFSHLSFYNLTSKQTSTGIVNGITGLKTTNGNSVVRYNLWNGFNNAGGTEPAPFVAVKVTNYTVTFNIVENMNSTILLPLNQSNVMEQNDVGTQIYSVLAGCVNPLVSNCGLAKTTALSAAHNLIHLVANNWFVGLTGQEFTVQLVGFTDHFANNTVENLNSAGGEGTSVNSGSFYANVTGNVCYGVYNYSYCVGSNEGGAWRSNYSANVAVDEDLTSWTGWSMDSSELWNSHAALDLNLRNGNQTQSEVNSAVPFLFRTTVVTLRNSTVDAVHFEGLGTGANFPNRAILPTDFNITLANSTPPASLFAFLRSLQVAHVGATWSVTTHANPSLLNLTGYLGLYGGSYYLVNSTWIKGETNLPMRVNGSIVLTIHQTTTARGYLWTTNNIFPSQILVAVNSSKAPNATATLYGHPSTGYYLWVKNSTSGSVISSVRVATDPQGRANATYNTTVDGLNATFTLSFSPTGPPLDAMSGAAFLGAIVVGIFAVLLLGALIVGRRSNRGSRRHSDPPYRKSRAERRRYDRIVRGVEASNRSGRSHANPYAIAQRDLNRRRMG